MTRRGNFTHDRTVGHPEWLTPPHILQALGPFDLDPCAPITRPWPMAARHFTTQDDGLLQPWHGFVFCNPPYGNETGKWLARCAEHGRAIALTFARTETKAFFDHVWPRASALLFIEGRLRFHTVDGQPGKTSSGAPSVLIAYSYEAAARLKASRLKGKVVEL